jgi:hypothetical protein
VSKTGVMVTAYARPELLRLVLESLKRQGALPFTNVWIDGTAGRRELTAKSKLCADIAGEYQVKEIRRHVGHLGIEKLMIDGLACMMERYEKIIILEDDCFPVSTAIDVFDKTLDEVANDESVFSVYGHHFLVSGEERRFSRFQGWGWATTVQKLRPVHSEVCRLFCLDEERYLGYVKSMLTPDVIARLDRTPPRNVLKTAARVFSWDSCTALITAARGLDHVPTQPRVIYNNGLDAKHGHFAPDEKFRRPPFNMIYPDEVWSVFDI